MKAPSTREGAEHPVKARLLVAWLLIGALAGGVARAAPPVPPAAPLPPLPIERPDAATLTRRLQRARVERGVGYGLAALGVAGLFVGGTLLGVAGQAPYADGSLYQVAGGITLGCGAALTIPGVALALLGQSAVDDARWRLRLLQHAWVAPGAGGAWMLGVAGSF